MHDPYRQYKQTAIHTASPEQLVLLLYDGAMKFLAEGRLALDQGKDGDEAIQRAQDIITELLAVLNPDAGELSVNLARLYEFFLFQLARGRARHDPDAVAEVLRLMQELREAFALANAQVRREREQPQALNVQNQRA